MPVLGQTNANTYGVTFSPGAEDTTDRIITGIQWTIGILSYITIIAVIYSFIMYIVWRGRLKKFDTEHKLADQQDYAKLNPDDAKQRSVMKKKIRIYRIIISVGVFMIIILLILRTMFSFRITS